MELKTIARVHCDFPDKFGLPRQSGLAAVEGTVVFEKEFRNPDALRGITDYSHLWMIWGFDRVTREGFSATVRPPRLGGNTRVGVFATRSPFRPNALGLTVVRLLGVEETADGMVLRVSGLDMADGTPIYDVKPYLPYVEAIADARGSFSDVHKEDRAAVYCPGNLLQKVPEAKRPILLSALAQDPRPAYQDDPSRVYGFPFAGLEVRFSVSNHTVCVKEIEKI